MIAHDKHEDVWTAVAVLLKSKLFKSAYLPLCITLSITALSARAQAQIAEATVGITVGNTVPTSFLGWSQPATDYTYYGQDTHCYTAPTGTFSTTINPTQITNVSNTYLISVGNGLVGADIASGATITNISGTTVTMSANAIGSGTAKTFDNLVTTIPVGVTPAQMLPTLPQCGINSIYRQLISNWKTNLGSGSTPLFRLEEDPEHPYDYTCNQIPVGQPVTGGWTTSGATNSTAVFTTAYTFTATENGTATLSAPSSLNYLRAGALVTGTGITAGTTITTITVGSSPTITLSAAATGSGVQTITPQLVFSGDVGYIHSFGSANAATAGINNPCTPQAYFAPYTVSAGASVSSFSVPIAYSSGTTLSGTENGYFSFQSKWYPAIPVPVCSTGTLNPPQSALIDPIADLAIETGDMNLSLGLDLASSQIVNGDQFGPTTGTVPPVPIMAYSPTEVKNWLTAFSGHTSLISYFELGNEPDNYSSQITTGYWGYRASTYDATSNTINPNDYWFKNFADVTTAITANGGTGGIPFLNPSTAGNAYHVNLIGSSSNALYGTIPTNPVSTPNNLTLVSEGLGADSQHNYPYGSQTICPAYPISTISRSTPNGNTVGTTTVTLPSTQPTNLMTTIAFGVTGSTTYTSTTGLVTATLANLDSITGIATSNNVITVTTSAATTVTHGQVIQINGLSATTVDKSINGQPLQVMSTSRSSFTASYPLFTVANQTSTSDSGYDQLYVYQGATGTTSLITNNTSLNMTGVTVASISPKIQPATITYTTSVGTPLNPGTLGNGGQIELTAMYGNVTNTALGSSNGSSLDMVPMANNAYGSPAGVKGSFQSTNNLNEAYPQGTSAVLGSSNTSPTSATTYPFYGSPSFGYQSSNFNQLGAVLMTASSPTTLTFPQTGVSDTASSGTLTLVAGAPSSSSSTYNTSINPAKNPTCNPQDLLMLPIASTKGTQLNASSILEAKLLSEGSSQTPKPYRMGEQNSMSPSQSGISNVLQDALWFADEVGQMATFNGSSGTTGGPLNSSFNGFDGFNQFTGEAVAYSMWQWTFSPGTSNGVKTFSLQNLVGGGPGVKPPYYAMLALSKLVGNGAKLVSVNSSSVIPNLAIYATVTNQTSAQYNVMIVNRSESVSGPVQITIPNPAYTTGTYTLVAAGQPAMVFSNNVTVTAVSGTGSATATFTFPTTGTPNSTNLVVGEPFTLSGFMGANSWLNQTIVIATISGGTVTANVTNASSLSGTPTGTATMHPIMFPNNVTVTAVSGIGNATATFTFPTTGTPNSTNLVIGEPFTLSGFTGANSWLNQNVTIVTVSGGTVTSSVTNASSLSGSPTGTAAEQCIGPSYQCQFGMQYGGQTFDGSLTGSLIGTASGLTVTGVPTSNTTAYTVNSPASSIVLLDLSP
jgi:hypothetical protein